MKLFIYSSIRYVFLGLLAYLGLMQLASAQQVVLYANNSSTVPDQVVTVLRGQPLTLSVTVPGSGYSWLKNDVEVLTNVATYSPLGTGYYRVRVNGDYSNYIYVEVKDATTDKCYTKQDLIRTDGIKDENSITGLTSAKLDQQITYLDGLGRPLQQINVASSPQEGRDVVQGYEYGPQGDQPRSYLPFAAGVDGQYKPYWQNDQSSFYNYAPKIGRPGGGPTYAEQVTDADPLGRLQQQAAPGDPWKLSNGHTRKQMQRSNVASDDVHLWIYTPNSTLGVVGTVSWGQVATPNTLQVAEITDEDGKLSVSYTNDLGQVVCSRVYLSGSPSNNSVAQYLETNYCYDVQGNTLAAIPPKATKQLLKATVSGAQALAELCSLTVYDNQGRAIAKKTPGIGWSYSVYDRWGRLAAQQDPHSNANGIGWTYIKYDALNRPIITGLSGDARDQSTLTSFLQQLTDDQRYELRASNQAGYTLTRSYPFDATENFVTTTRYYDDYEYSPLQRTDLAYSVPSQLSNQPAVTTQTRGLRTGGRQRILSDDQDLGRWLTTVTYYDEFARPIQSVQDNHTGVSAVDRTSMHYEGGLLTQTYQDHQRYSDTGALENHSVKTTNQYDAKGRLLTVSESIDRSQEVRLVAYEYNELGQLVDKKLGYNPTDGSYLQSLDYRYNIRGWLTNINNRNLSEQWLDDADPNKDSDAGADVFGLELKYANDNPRCYNGNIAAAIWNTGTPKGLMRRYVYGYDNANRLLKADYSAYTRQPSGNFSFDGEKDDQYQEGRYTLKDLTYDDNGNILSLKRNGLLDVYGSTKQFGQIDNLQLDYGTGNKLQTAADIARLGLTAATNDFEDNGVSGSQYSHDIMGSVEYDPHKKAYTSYNYLNLPFEIDIDYNQLGQTQYYISNTYSTTGEKLRAVYYSLNATVNRYDVVKAVDYVGGFTYTSNAPTTLATPVGRAVVVQPGTQYNALWSAEYHIRDHQGSLRLVIRQDPRVTMFAGMEPSNRQREEEDFDNVSNTRQLDPDHARSGDYAARLNARQANRMTGPYATLSVTAGDSIQVEVYGRYDGATKNNLLTATAIASAVSLPTSTTGDPAKSEIRQPQQRKLPAIFLGITTTWSKLAGLFTKRDNELPSASLTYEFYDRDSTLVSTTTEYLNEDGRQNWQQLTGGGKAQKDGYVKVFLANASGKDVWFDDLRITALPIATIQENHYDPFGQNLPELETASISDAQQQYTGQEKIDDFNLNLYDYSARYYDFQLGRFNGIDQAARSYPGQGVYNYVANNPVNNIDPNGRVLFATAAILNAIFESAALGAFFNAASQLSSGKNFDWASLAGSTVTGGVAGTLSALTPNKYFNKLSLPKRYAAKALYAGFTGAISTGLGMLTEDILNDGELNTNSYRYAKSIGLAGAISAGISLGVSAFDYLTWDRFTSVEKIAKLNAQYGTEMTYDSELPYDGSTVPEGTKLSDRGVDRRAQGELVTIHERQHYTDFSSDLDVPLMPPNLNVDADQYYTNFMEIRAYSTEMRAFSNHFWPSRYYNSDMNKIQRFYSPHPPGYGLGTLTPFNLLANLLR